MGYGQGAYPGRGTVMPAARCLIEAAKMPGRSLPGLFNGFL